MSVSPALAPVVDTTGEEHVEAFPLPTDPAYELSEALIAEEASNTNNSGVEGGYIQYTIVEVNQNNLDNIEVTEQGLTTSSLDVQQQQQQQQQQLTTDSILEISPIEQIGQEQDQQELLIKYENFIQCDTCFQIFSSQASFDSHVDYCQAPSSSDTTTVSISENPQPTESDVFSVSAHPVSVNINPSNDVQPVAISGRRKQRIESRKVEEGNFDEIPTLKVNRPVTSVSIPADGNLKRKAITDYQDPLGRKKIVYVNPKLDPQALLNASAKTNAELLRRKQVQIAGKVLLSVDSSKQVTQNKSGLAAASAAKTYTLQVLPTPKVNTQTSDKKVVPVKRKPDHTGLLCDSLFSANSNDGKKLVKTQVSLEDVNRTAKQFIQVKSAGGDKKYLSKNPNVQLVGPSDIQNSPAAVRQSLALASRKVVSSELKPKVVVEGRPGKKQAILREPIDEGQNKRRPGRPRKSSMTESPRAELQGSSSSDVSLSNVATDIVSVDNEKRRPGRPSKKSKELVKTGESHQVQGNNGEIRAVKAKMSTEPSPAKKDNSSRDSQSPQRNKEVEKSLSDDGKRKPGRPKKRFLPDSTADRKVEKFSKKSQNETAAGGGGDGKISSSVTPTSGVLEETVVVQSKEPSTLIPAPLKDDVTVKASSGEPVPKKRGRPAKNPKPIIAPVISKDKSSDENVSRTGRRRIRSTKLLDFVDTSNLDEEAM